MELSTTNATGIYEETGMRQIPDRKWTLYAAAVLAVIAWSEGAPRAAQGFHQAPPLSLPDLDGRTTVVDFSEAKLTLVNFWATWCLPCKDELPQISRLARKYGERGFRAVGVAVESGNASDVRDFLKENLINLSFPVLMGDDETTTSFGNIEILPTSYLVGPEGEVVETHIGVKEDFEESLGAEIEGFLDGAGLAQNPSARRAGPGSP
jgi:thiol-disulfide isomerase/thioredoxin